MKIYYEPYRGFNKIYDFTYPNNMVMELSFIEPEEPKLMREIGVDYIVGKITKRNGFIYLFTELSLMEQLLPEQIRVLWSHAFRIYHYYQFLSKSRFTTRFRNEVKKIAEQEIEPGMF
ncbi:MAG: hypothetical protein ACXACY_23590 [Candidatus Hodarchaeales archaeon]|jgi:hypothetical protein